jgi:hypothetical protein
VVGCVRIRREDCRVIFGNRLPCGRPSIERSNAHLPHSASILGAKRPLFWRAAAVVPENEHFWANGGHATAVAAAAAAAMCLYGGFGR